MKKLTGFVAIALVLLAAVYIILRMYGVPVFSPELLSKIYITVGIVAVTSVLLLMFIPFFFKNNFEGYDRGSGNVAHPKR